MPRVSLQMSLDVAGGDSDDSVSDLAQRIAENAQFLETPLLPADLIRRLALNVGQAGPVERSYPPDVIAQMNRLLDDTLAPRRSLKNLVNRKFDKPAEPSTDLPWATTTRLSFLEETVYWTDAINRRDLIDKFGISEQQASADLTRYQELAPDNLVYDKSGKAYRAGLMFEPRFFKIDPDAVLSRLRLVAEGVSEDHPIIGGLALGLAPAPVRPVDPDVLRTVIRAIREKRQMSAHYVSFTQTDGRMRVIEPHALVYDGFRWHARARDVEVNAYKDYVLGRLSKAGLLNDAVVPAGHDREWFKWTVLVIAANPGLSPAQKKIIERDYGMHNGAAELRVRAALAYYAKHRLGLDLPASARRPEDQHVVLLEEREE